MKRRAPSTAVLLASVALALAGCADAPIAAVAAPRAEVPPAGITSRGVGTVTANPDTVTVVLGVQTRDGSARAALDTNNARTAALIEVLTSSGVAPEDLQTSQLSIFPTFDPSNGGVTGYEVTNQLTATLRDVGGAGALIDAAGAAADDDVRVQQLSFSIDDDSAARAEARAAAVRRALAQATQLAEAAGVALGPIRTITEMPSIPPGPFPLDRAAQADAAAVPIEPGSQEVTVTVEIVHGIDQ